MVTVWAAVKSTAEKVMMQSKTDTEIPLVLMCTKRELVNEKGQEARL